jgi:Tfp pilus assembly protein PilO
MRKQSRVALFLMMPLAVFFWILGWSLYWIGSNKKLTELEKRNSSKDLAFTVLMPEAKYAK